MARGKPLTAKLYVIVNGENVPWLEIDEAGKITYFMDEQSQQEYRRRSGKNAGRVMSDFYSNHPEYTP